MLRSYRELRLRQELTRSVQTNLFVPLARGAFVIHALPYVDREKKMVEQLIRQLKILQEKLVSDEELRRAKLTLEKEIIFSDETAEGRAKTLGYFQLTYGDFQEEERYRARIMRVTERQVQDVARRYFNFGANGSGAPFCPNKIGFPFPEEIQGWISRGAKNSRGRKKDV